jgi:hypothetical protein
MGKKAKNRATEHDVLAGTVPVATFASLGEVQDALAGVADEGFGIDRATIVGTDLRLVEKVSGRMTAARAAGYGTVAGAWLGALIAAFAAIFTAKSVGAVFGAIAYRFAGPRDGITGNVTLVASRYELRCDPDSAEWLRDRLVHPDEAASPVPPASADDLLARH